MKRIIVSLALCMLALCVRAESPYNIRVWAILGPDRSQTNEYAAFASNQVRNIYFGGAPTNTLGYRVMTDYVAQDQNRTKQTLWFAVQASVDYTVTNANARFRASQLRFTGSSSDPNNYLATLRTFGASNIVFSPSFMGIVHGPGGPRSNDMIYASTANNIANVDLDEVIFIGAQLVYFTYNNPAQYSQIDDAIWGYPNWMASGMWELTNGPTVLAWAKKSLETKRTPLKPAISINANASWVNLGINGDVANSGILYMREKVNSPWKFMKVVNGGDTFVRPAQFQYYYEAFNN
jgi:hypothetical protein